MSEKVKVYVAIPSTGAVSDVIPYALRQYERDYADKIEFVYPPNCTHRKFHDFARNCMVDDFLASGADIMWFLDSDVVPPPHLMDLVAEHGDKWDLAGAPYPVFMTPSGYERPQIVMCVYTADESGGLHASKVPNDGQAFVEGLATGCIFIKRHVFEKLEKPYFEFKFRTEDRHMTEGEDLGFCKKVNALGFKFFTDFSMVCGHYKQINLLEMNNYAIDYARASVESYAAQVKREVQPIIKAAYEKGRAEAQPQGRTKSGIILPD